MVEDREWCKVVLLIRTWWFAVWDYTAPGTEWSLGRGRGRRVLRARLFEYLCLWTSRRPVNRAEWLCCPQGAGLSSYPPSFLFSCWCVGLPSGPGGVELSSVLPSIHWSSVKCLPEGCVTEGPPLGTGPTGDLTRVIRQKTVGQQHACTYFVFRRMGEARSRARWLQSWLSGRGGTPRVPRNQSTGSVAGLGCGATPSAPGILHGMLSSFQNLP